VAENPFLLPPGPTPTPTSSPTPASKPEPTIVPQATPPSRDPDRYIALPPSIESATHRIARPETAPTIVSPPAEPAAPSPVSEPVAEETRLAAVPTAAPEASPTSFLLVLPDGTRVAVDGPIVLGRDPAPPALRPGARSVPLDDPGKTVSKTHALIEPAAPGAGLRVTELYSTNGVTITADGTRSVLAAGGDALAPRGAVIELGSYTLLVDAR
jgi:hypothetical protein